MSGYGVQNKEHVNKNRALKVANIYKIAMKRCRVDFLTGTRCNDDGYNLN